jgi:hypothetical protein
VLNGVLTREVRVATTFRCQIDLEFPNITFNR